MPLESLNDVMIDLVKDMYHAEKQLVKALPKMAKAADSDALRTALEDHLEETKGHVERLEEAFAALGVRPAGKPCHGMAGLIEEAKEVLEEAGEGHPAAVDAAIIAAAQKVEHYEITAYGTLVSFATTLGQGDIAEIFQGLLDEEEAADDKLTGLAEGSINSEAADAREEADEGNVTPRAKKKPARRARSA